MAPPPARKIENRWRESRTNFWQTRVVFNVAQPTLTVFQPEPGKWTGAAVAICPGGAFHALAIDSEGFEVARWLAEKGITSFALKYRLVECKTDDPTREVMSKGGNLKEVVAPIVRLAMADGLAPQSVALYQHWTAAKKPVERHLYSKGGHGFGMRKQNPPADHWIERFTDWLEAQRLLKK